MLSPAEFLKAQMTQAKKEYGPQVYIAGDHYIRQFGIPLKSLALQYLYGVENLPVGRFYGFSGAKGSFKSSIVFWLLRNTMAQGGLATLVESERKVSDTLMHGIIGQYMNQLLQLNATTLEETQEMLNKNCFAYYKKNVPERHLPYAIGWDSLRGVLSEQTSNKIDKEGHYTRQFSSEAHSISPFFAKMVEELSFWPMILFFVQHQKKKQQEGGPPGMAGGTSTLGGDAPGFHATALTTCTATAKKSKEDARNPWAQFQLRTSKNNLGLYGRRVLADIHFHEDVQDNGQRVLNYFIDWDKADCDVLLSDKLANKSGVKEVMGLREMSQKGMYACPELGLEKVPASEIMAALRDPSNEELFYELKANMGITRNLRFDEVEWAKVGGTDKNPICDWQVKEGVDLSRIRNVSMEEYTAEQREDPDHADA